MKISVKVLIRLLLPFHKHQPNRLSILNVLVPKGQQDMDRLTQCKDNALAALNVTGQTMILQDHLSKLFSANISIVHGRDNSLNVGMIEDGEFTFAGLGLDALDGPFVAVAIQGEDQSALLFDYQINAPVGISVAALTAELHKYRLAGKRFEIVLN